jgi:predicted transcriptional regulator
MRRQQNPELYKIITFEKWIAFLVSSGLTVETSDGYQTTPYGRGFLKYVVDMHLITPKAY